MLCINKSDNTTLFLSSTSAKGVFSRDVIPWVNVTSVTIPPGQSSASFYYRDGSIGTPTVTVSDSAGIRKMYAIGLKSLLHSLLHNR